MALKRKHPSLQVTASLWSDRNFLSQWIPIFCVFSSRHIFLERNKQCSYFSPERPESWWSWCSLQHPAEVVNKGGCLLVCVNVPVNLAWVILSGEQWHAQSMGNLPGSERRNHSFHLPTHHPEERAPHPNLFPWLGWKQVFTTPFGGTEENVQ